MNYLFLQIHLTGISLPLCFRPFEVQADPSAADPIRRPAADPMVPSAVQPAAMPSEDSSASVQPEEIATADPPPVVQITVNDSSDSFLTDEILSSWTYPAYHVYLQKENRVCFTMPDQQTQLLADGHQYQMYKTSASTDEEVQILLWAALQCELLRHGILTLHSSTVALDNRAYCFTAESGRGKSTRAANWVSALGAEWISGDRPAISPSKGIVYGVPWDGKEQIFRNVQYPAACIFEVRRSPVTMLRRLTEKQMYECLIRQVFIPMWDPELSASALRLLQQLCRNTTGFRLFCGPDEKAAIETLDILWNHPEQIKKEESAEMKLKNCVIKEMDGDYNLIPIGDQVDTMKGIIILNSVSAFILEQIREKSLAREDLLAMLLAKYEVSEEEASEALDELLEKIRSFGMLEETE